MVRAYLHHWSQQVDLKMVNPASLKMTHKISPQKGMGAHEYDNKQWEEDVHKDWYDHLHHHHSAGKETERGEHISVSPYPARHWIWRLRQMIGNAAQPGDHLWLFLAVVRWLSLPKKCEQSSSLILTEGHTSYMKTLSSPPHMNWNWAETKFWIPVHSRQGENSLRMDSQTQVNRQQHQEPSTLNSSHDSAGEMGILNICGRFSMSRRELCCKGFLPSMLLTAIRGWGEWVEQCNNSTPYRYLQEKWGSWTTTWKSSCNCTEHGKTTQTKPGATEPRNV